MTTGNSNMATQTGSTYNICQSVIDVVEIPTANLSCRPHYADRRKHVSLIGHIIGGRHYSPSYCNGPKPTYCNTNIAY